MPEITPPEQPDINKFVDEHPEIADLAQLAIQTTDPELEVRHFYTAYRAPLI